MRAAASWIAMAVALAWPLAAAAQSTAIVPDVGSARALGTTVLQSGNVFTVGGGTLAGANLFHSFSQFSLGAGDTASWTRTGGDAGAVRNVINRVTGGQTSRISGTIDSTGLPNASFFFINPAGIVFGAGARVNVPAAAYFSTAAELRFADGAKFAVATPGGSSLTMAAPESFGFVGGQGAIDVEGAGQGFAPATAALSFSGSDVRFARAAQALDDRLVVRGLDLVAVGSGAAQVSLADPLAAAASGAVDVQRSAVVITNGDTASSGLRINGGAVRLDQFNVISDAGGAQRGGDVRVRADQLDITGAATLIGTSARAGGAGGDVEFRARSIAMTGGSIFSVSTTAAPGGQVGLFADDLTVTGSTLTSTNSGFGPGGDLRLAGAQTMLLDAANVISSTVGPGRGGSLAISAPSLQLFAANLLSASLGAAMPGNVNIDGGVIEISGGNYGTSPGLRSDSGALVVNATTRLFADGGNFIATSASERGAGSITIRSPIVVMTQGSIRADNFGDGGAGMVLIESGNLVLDRMTIGVEANGDPGDRVGLVRLKSTGDLRLNISEITSNTNKRASAGIVEIAGKDVQLLDSRVRSDTIGLATGDAGSVAITADTLLIRNGLVTSSSDSAGDAGDVRVQARTIALDTDAAIRSDALDSGNAGGVNIIAGSLSLSDGAAITSRAQKGTGNAGEVTVVADSVSLVDARISSGTDTAGAGGTVTLKVGQLLLDGARRGFTFITSDAGGSGDAGAVLIDAKSVTLRNGGFISSDSFQSGSGDAGNISIRADTLTVQDGGSISSDTRSDGKAGDISIVVAGTLSVLGNGFDNTSISSDTFGAGDAGAVAIQAKTLRLDQRAFISSDTYTGANAGDISVKSDSITLSDFASIRSRTLSEGEAGSITIGTGDLTLRTGGIISSAATQDSFGPAGFIDIVANTVTVGEQSMISTSSRGAGDAGEVGIVAKTLTVDSGLITSAAEMGGTGAANTLRIKADTLAVTNGGAISTVSFNPKRAGLIDITAGALLVDGARSFISSENQAGNGLLSAPPGPGGDAGDVQIQAGEMRVSNGGRITTNSFGGAAGNIQITIPRSGILVLEGATAPGAIQTSSGQATGGRITIAEPLAIISNGGAILALGKDRGANVVIQTGNFINSSDRINVVAVDGDFRLEGAVGDVSSGTVTRDLSVLDASKVLRGQCPVARATGVLSQLITRPVGPYAREPSVPAPQGPPPGRVQLNLGGCS